MRGLIERTFGATLPSRLGGGLILAGLALLVYSGGAYFGLLPGGYTSVPEPVALAGSGQREARLESPPIAPAATVAASMPPTVLPTAPPSAPITAAAPVVEPTAPPVVLKAEPADSVERRNAVSAPRPGPPLRIEIPSIEVATEIQEAGVVPGPDGEPEWQTLPFVAASYPLLGPVGAPGNPVISGHVVTLNEGNVFRNLYRLQLGETVEVFTTDSRFTYVIEQIKLVEPSEVSVMAPSEDARLTLITCGGTFDPRTRTFSDRLIVVGKLAGGERL